MITSTPTILQVPDRSTNVCAELVIAGDRRGGRMKVGEQLPVQVTHSGCATLGGDIYMSGGLRGGRGRGYSDQVFLLREGRWRLTRPRR